MKKTLLLLFISLTSLLSWAQIVSTNPTFVTQNSGQIEVTFDASLGSGGLKDYSGTDVYAHTGVITSASASNSDWKHAPTWLDNSAKYKLTSLGSNKWKLIISPNLKDYYGLADGEIVTKMAFVFRNSTGALEGKNTGGTDIFVDVYQSGLNVAFTNPASNQAVTKGTAMNIAVSSSISATTLNLYINGEKLKTVNNATTLSYAYTFATENDYTLIAEAVLGVTVRDTVLICVPKPVTNQARPAGTQAGINYINANSATLVLHAPNKSNVFLIGEFNNWSQLNDYQLKKDGEYWWITLSNLNSGQIYAYQYLVDGTLRVSDPYTEMVLDPWNDKWINENYSIYPNLKAYPESKTEGIVATLQTSKPTYSWQNSSFTMSARENMVIYELLLRDFTPEKSLQAAIGKLDYLKNLGVTAIELMPIQEFDGNNSWGYNPSHYFAPDKAYGNADNYKNFIDECHSRGIAVILDIVLNHATGDSPFAKLFWNDQHSPYPAPSASNPWMNETAPHPYSVLNDFNHSYQGTRDHFKRMIQYWITEYKVDGYRLDLTKGLTQKNSSEATASNYDQSRIDILTEYYNAATAVKSDVMFILEHFCNNDEETALANKGMFLWRKVNDAYSQAAMGYQASSDFSAMNSFPRKWVGFAESHDEERNFYKALMFGDGVIKTDSIARIKRVPLNIAFATLLPGPKMLWEFQELGYDKSIDSYGGRTDPKPSAWGFLDLAHRKAAYDASAKIISLRKAFPTAFTEGNFSLSIGTSDWENGRRIALSHADLNLIVLGNFKSSSPITAFPNFQKTGSWYNLLTGNIYYVGSVNTPITIPAGEVMIFVDRDLTTAVEKTQSEKVAEKLYPTYTTGKVFITNQIPQAVSVFNMQGQLLKSEKNITEFDLSNFASGVYLIQMDSYEGRYTGKVIKE